MKQRSYIMELGRDEVSRSRFSRFKELIFCCFVDHTFIHGSKYCSICGKRKELC